MDQAPVPTSFEELLGSRIIIGITRVDHAGQLLHQEQYYGYVESLDDGLIHVRLASTGGDFTLPPDLTAFVPASPGKYRLRSTGEVVEDPDYTVSWTVKAPPPGWQPESDAP